MMTTMTIAEPQAGQRFEVKNGMGGVFIVRLLERLSSGWQVRVDMPRNPDWDQYLIDDVQTSSLLPLRADW